MATSPQSAAQSTSATPFLWEHEGTWEAALEASSAAYVALHPDLAVPESAEVVAALAKRGRDLGVERMVLLSRRGELFQRLLDGRSAHPTDAVEGVLGRPPTTYATWANNAAAQGVWER